MAPAIPPYIGSGKTYAWMYDQIVRRRPRRLSQLMWSRTLEAACEIVWKPTDTAVARSRWSPGHYRSRRTCFPLTRRQGNSFL
jgi:hypothetical protein